MTLIYWQIVKPIANQPQKLIAFWLANKAGDLQLYGHLPNWKWNRLLVQ